MNRNLCIDIGNTRFKLGVFDKDLMVFHEVCHKEDLKEILENIFSSNSISGIIVSSTRKGIPDLIRSYGEKVKTFIELSHKIPLPFSIEYDTPETLGRDRIAGAAGANFLYPKEGKIIIDAGTCVTYDFVNSEGVFKGGNISPGMRMRLKAMDEFTANLPLPEFELPDKELGFSTHSALQNGAMRGTIYEIESFIRVIERKYGDCRVILTGGDANYFAYYFNSKIFVVQNLVLLGLNQIIKHNA